MAITPEEIKSRLSANYMAIRPTLTGANAVDDKRQQQIFTNLQKGYNTNQAQFTDRQAFESAYGYAEKPSGEKIILDTFYKTVNPEPVPNTKNDFVIKSTINSTPVSQMQNEPAKNTTGVGSMTYRVKPVAQGADLTGKNVKTVAPTTTVPVKTTATTSTPTPKTSLIKKGTLSDGSSVEVHDYIDNQKLSVIKSPTGEMSWRIDYPDGTSKSGRGTLNNPIAEPVRVPNVRKAPATTSTTAVPATTSTTAAPEFTYTPKSETKKEDTKVTSFATTNKDILNANEESLQAAKYDQLLRMKNNDITNAETEYQKGLKVLQDTNANIRALYGIDEKGNIDPKNTTSLAFTQKAALADYKKTKEDLLSGYTGTRLNNVKAQMFQMLAQRNVTDVNKVSPELLLQLSGEVGAAAMNDIYQAKEKTVNDIEARKKEVQAKLDQLRENGLIKNNEFAVASETLRASTEKLKQSVEKQFSNDVFGLIDLKNTKAEARGTDVLNTIQRFAAQVGITGKGLSALNDYVGRYKNSADALTAMISDLSNPNSNLYKGIDTAEKRAAIQAALTQQQKLELAQAQKKGAADGTSMSWGLPARTYLASSFINAVKDGLADAVTKSERKNLANTIASAYYATQGQTPAV